MNLITNESENQQIYSELNTWFDSLFEVVSEIKHFDIEFEDQNLNWLQTALSKIIDFCIVVIELFVTNACI